MYDNVPAWVVVPKVKRLVAVVLILPAVIVSVPLMESGVSIVIPMAFELLTVKFVKLAVDEVVELRKVPEPEIV